MKAITNTGEPNAEDAYVDLDATSVKGTIEQDSERNFVMLLTNDLGKTLDNATFVYAARSGSEEGVGPWVERTISIESGRLRPDVETLAVTSEFDDWYTDFVYLGTGYSVDKEAGDAKLSDEFSYELSDGKYGRVLKLTNNTGHYLSEVAIWHAWLQTSYPEGWHSAVDTYTSLKPGETYEVEIKGPEGDIEEAVVNDIMYKVDEEKEASAQ